MLPRRYDRFVKRGWRAELKHVTGSREHVAMMIGKGGIAPLPDPVALRILVDGAGYSLLRLDKAGTSIAHTWHPTLDAAKSAAATAFGVAAEEWSEEAR